MKPAPIKELATIDDLAKLDIRVGTIVAVGEVEGSKKLVKLTVDFGDHTRTILAGMKQEREDPAEITGKQALFVVNLAPRKMAGVMVAEPLSPSAAFIRSAEAWSTATGSVEAAIPMSGTMGASVCP